MATTMVASTVSLRLAGSSLVSVPPAKLARQAASSPVGLTIRCNNADALEGEKSCTAELAKKGAAPLSRLSAVMVPMLAAAVVGGVQPAVQASEWDKLLVPVDYTETSSSDAPYKDLLEKMKERRAAREKKAPAVEAKEDESVEEPKPFSSLFFSPAPVYTPPATPAPAPTPAPTPAPVVAEPSPVQEVVAPVVAAEKQTTHGFLPLFLVQFLLLGATVGGGYVLITTPDSKWEEVQKSVDGYVSKVTPVVEDSWTKAKPIATQAQEKASQFVEVAKPYAIKAWEVSQPLVGKAVEASKPILKGAQTKAVEIFKEATSNKQ